MVNGCINIIFFGYAAIVLEGFLGAVVLVDPQGEIRHTKSSMVHFSTAWVEEARERGFATTPVGTIIAKRTVCDQHDPHLLVTQEQICRKQLLIESPTALLQHFLSHSEDSMVPKLHVVTIGTLTLTLPIREVAPGISVALFNPLGDWKVNEAAGIELAKRIPNHIDILVMPDGKAQALLHVIGRESSLPTIIARKEKKPYMRDTISVTVKSITTDKPQTLHVDGTDAEILKGKRVMIVDDVVSTGGTLDAMKRLLEQTGATYEGTLAVFTEGPAIRPDVIALGILPLY